MKFRLTAIITVILLISVLVFTGCSKGGTGANGSIAQSTLSNNDESSSLAAAGAKTITDTELINSAKDDPSIQLDLPEDEAQALSSDDFDTLLDDNSVLKDIPERVSVK